MKTELLAEWAFAANSSGKNSSLKVCRLSKVVEEATAMPSVFLSHSGRDNEIARNVALDLKMSSIRVWLDEWEILVGHSIPHKIEAGLDEADFVVVLLSGHAVVSGWVEKEWMSVVGDEAERQETIILPVRIGDCEIPRLLRGKKYADLQADYDQGMKDLLAAIRGHSLGADAVGPGAQIGAGRIVYGQPTPDIPILDGLINTITGGYLERDGDGIVIHVHVVASHAHTQEFAVKTGNDRILLRTGDFTISTDEAHPTILVGRQDLVVKRGEVLRDLATGRSAALPMDLTGRSTFEVRAFVEAGVIRGDFRSNHEFKGAPLLSRFSVPGTFEVTVDFDRRPT